MSNTKSWLSYREQLAQLKDRGLHVENEARALHYLERLGYYRLSGYWYPFRELNTDITGNNKVPSRKDTFIVGSRFEDAVELYIFDKKLRLLALDALERIEMAVRVDVAYCLGKLSPYAHENALFLHGNFSKQNKKHPTTKYDNWLKRYESTVNRAKNEPFIKHHQDNYGGKLPIWVAIEIFDFGLLSQLYAGMKHNHKNEIAKKYDIIPENTFEKWLRSFNLIRNVSAHHSRLWNINIVERSPVPENFQDWQALDNSKPFLYFCLMQKLLTVICPNSSWKARFTTLIKEYPDIACNAVSLKDLGVVPGWDEWDIWAKK